MALAVLAAVSVDARNQVRQEADGTPPGRLLRIALSAAVLAGGIVLFMVVDEILRVGVNDDLLPSSLIALAVATTIFLVLVTVLDFWVGWLAPRRSRKWLALAVLVFIILISTALGLALWLGGALDQALDPEVLELLVVAAAAGITWWSRLPPPEVGIERRFE
jgi:hypothetical protein